jgi:hypothetical protein
MALTTTETFGFCTAVSQFMQTNQATLTAAGLTVAPWMTDLDALRQDAVEKNDAQEALKAQLRDATAASNAALTAAYNSASTRLDAMIGALGKTSELGKQAARLRSDIRRGSTPPAPTPPST